MSLATKEAVLNNLQVQLATRQVPMVVPGSDIDQSRQRHIFNDAVNFYFDIGNLELFKAIANFDGFWIRTDPERVYDDLTLLIRHGDNIAEAFFDYFFQTTESNWSEPHDYDDDILRGLDQFYERLRDTYATPELYLYRLELLGLVDANRNDQDLRFAWDCAQVQTRLRTLRDYHNQV
jgi:hypothetical protein